MDRVPKVSPALYFSAVALGIVKVWPNIWMANSDKENHLPWVNTATCEKQQNVHWSYVMNFEEQFDNQEENVRFLVSFRSVSKKQYY